MIGRGAIDVRHTPNRIKASWLQRLIGEHGAPPPRAKAMATPPTGTNLICRRSHPGWLLQALPPSLSPHGAPAPPSLRSSAHSLSCAAGLLARQRIAQAMARPTGSWPSSSSSPSSHTRRRSSSWPALQQQQPQGGPGPEQAGTCAHMRTVNVCRKRGVLVGRPYACVGTGAYQCSRARGCPCVGRLACRSATASHGSMCLRQARISGWLAGWTAGICRVVRIGGPSPPLPLSPHAHQLRGQRAVL